jgi:hypothetical protein
MFRAIAPLKSNAHKFDPRRALENPAVARCQLSWERAYHPAMRLTKCRMLARREAREAFRLALPALSCLENIGNFIACIAFAVTTGIFSDGYEAELLHEAQLAIHTSALRSRKARTVSRS